MPPSIPERQKVCSHIHVVSLDGKLERFVTKKWEKLLPNSNQTEYSNVSNFIFNFS